MHQLHKKQILTVA